MVYKRVSTPVSTYTQKEAGMKRGRPNEIRKKAVNRIDPDSHTTNRPSKARLQMERVTRNEEEIVSVETPKKAITKMHESRDE